MRDESGIHTGSKGMPLTIYFHPPGQIISFFITNPIISYVAAGLVALGVVLLVVFGQNTDWVGRNSDQDEQTIIDAKQVWA
jgi:hypothetical protein